MSAFKQLLASDIIVSPFEVNKAFTFNGLAALTGSNVGIEVFTGQNLQTLFTPSDPTTGQTSLEYKRLVYNSVKQLYYSNYLNSLYGDPVSVPYTIPGANPAGDVLVGSASSAGRFENYLQTTISYERYFPTESNAVIAVLSIPSKLYGDRIQPGSVRINSESGSLVDDGNGNLITVIGDVCGNILYSHGIITITSDGSGGSKYGTANYGVDLYGGDDTYFINNFLTSPNISCSFSSSFTLFETQYKCTVDTSEFNFSQNPSLISSSLTGHIYDFATGSYFNPYVTTVGLYNENQELLAVGKLSKPLPSNNTTDLTVLINIDR